MAEDEKRPGTDGTSAGEKQTANAVQAYPDGGGTKAASRFLGFVGSYTHGIDAKGRMIIPAAFREALGPQFAVCPTPDFQDVAIYTLDGWTERRDELQALVHKNAQAQPLLDKFGKYSYVDCETDAQGRLLLPQKIRSWRLGDAREVDVNGATTYIRVMSAAKSRKQDEDFDEIFADPLAFIASLQTGKDA